MRRNSRAAHRSGSLVRPKRVAAAVAVLVHGRLRESGTTKQSIEVVVLLWALQLRHPTALFLLRGNHEFRAVNRGYGFLNELKERYRDDGESIWDEFNSPRSFHPASCVYTAESVLP